LIAPDPSLTDEARTDIAPTGHHAPDRAEAFSGVRQSMSTSCCGLRGRLTYLWSSRPGWNWWSTLGSHKRSSVMSDNTTGRSKIPRVRPCECQLRVKRDGSAMSAFLPPYPWRPTFFVSVGMS